MPVGAGSKAALLLVDPMSQDTSANPNASANTSIAKETLNFFIRNSFADLPHIKR
jgi:hypothetical protein